MLMIALKLRMPFTQSFIIASFLAGLFFISQGHLIFYIFDESFLWYGVQRVLLGEVPIRDFASYDPGRYYWSASVMSLIGQRGIMGLRIAETLFQAIGLSFGLWLIARTQKKQNFMYLLLSGIILIIWMYPRYKFFDLSISIFLMSILTALIEHPNKKFFFLTGLCIGLFAVFGRNHGVYGLISSLGVFIWLNVKKTESFTRRTTFAFWALGIMIGFLPILLMMLFIPGFCSAFIDSVRFLFETKTTNLTLPIPWPWHIHFVMQSHYQILYNLFVGLFFVAILLFGILAPIIVFWKKWQCRPLPAAFVAAAFAALPYAHYAYSRADVEHLTHGIFPFLIGCLIFITTQNAKVKWILALLLFETSLVVMLPWQPAWRCRLDQSCINVQISDSTLKVDPYTARDIALLRQLSAQYTPQGQSFVATPIWPGAYALLERKSPLYDIYAFYPRSIPFQQREISRLEMAKPAFVLLLDVAVDGREDLRFKNLDPLIYQYIITHFEPLNDSPSPEIKIYIPKQN